MLAAPWNREKQLAFCLVSPSSLDLGTTVKAAKRVILGTLLAYRPNKLGTPNAMEANFKEFSTRNDVDNS